MDKPSQFPAFLFPGSQSEKETCWRPPVDVYRVRDGWLLKFDLAGVRPEDVKVEARGCRVTVSGVRRDLLVEESASYYSMEIAYNRFERTVDLPCQFETPAVAMEHRDGILIVRITS
jgi:HSP20 family protein